MTIKNGSLRLAPRSGVAGLQRPIDNFAIALAEEKDSGAIGVVLSGTGSDGTYGLKAIKAAGGRRSHRSRHSPVASHSAERLTYTQAAVRLRSRAKADRGSNWPAIPKSATPYPAHSARRSPEGRTPL